MGKWNWSVAELDVVNIGRKKLEVTPIFPAYRQAGIIPILQKHNTSI